MVEKEKDDEYMLSIVMGLDGFNEKYPVSEFKEYLNADDDLSSNKEKNGWGFWRESESEINEIIKSLLQEILSDCLYPSEYVVQFWAAEKDGEQVIHLITSDQPFGVGGDLYKGFCWYRKQCLNYRYNTEMGPVGRAYRNKRPECSPDLRLYSTSEFPLRDHAARCGMRGYMAMPIFHMNNNQHCYGVLEFLYFGSESMSGISLILLGTKLQDKFKFVPYSGRQHRHSGHHQRPIIVPDDTDSVLKKIKGGMKMKKTGRLNLTLKALKPHFGTKLKDVAMELGVSISTIKRACREYGIDRWPCNENQKKNPSLFEVEREDKYSLKNICNNRQNLAQASTESSTSHLNVQPIKADMVMIKVKYDDDTVKFQLCLSSGMEKLVEEVASRLKLEMGSFKLKYMDEDDDEILLACDADLQLCAKNQTALGKTFIQLFVQLSRK